MQTITWLCFMIIGHLFIWCHYYDVIGHWFLFAITGHWFIYYLCIVTNSYVELHLLKLPKICSRQDANVAPIFIRDSHI